MHVKIVRSLMEKRYLAELIGEKYVRWDGKKIIITAPTGMGKTTFILEVLLPYLKARRKKLLILCNRRLLRMQYWNELLKKFDCYGDLQESVELKTYQQLAKEIENGGLMEDLLCGCSVIVCDEAHYFYADSDFNGFGTYVLLQELIRAGIGREMIFLSATTEKVKPLIDQTIKNCGTHLRLSSDRRLSLECTQILEYDYSHLEDYTRFKCMSVPDEDTMCEIFASSPKKSIIFLDDKDKAASIKKKMENRGIESKQIVVLNAENLDDTQNKRFVEKLTITHKLDCKIFITTSVIDNGVSIHDSDVENLAIITESKTSFIQMLGRVRAESSEFCNLFFLLRKDSEFQKRKLRYEKQKERFEKLEKENLHKKWRHYFYTVWERDDEEMADFYHKALVYCKHESQFFILPESKVQVLYGNEGFYINEFAKQKTEDMCMLENKFEYMALTDPLEVIYEQMSWLAKRKEELQVLGSTHIEEKTREMEGKLLQVQDFSNEELQKLKEDLVKEFRSDLFPEIEAKNGTLSLGKLKSICRNVGLEVIESEDENRRKRYSIVKEVK